MKKKFVTIFYGIKKEDFVTIFYRIEKWIIMKKYKNS